MGIETQTTKDRIEINPKASGMTTETQIPEQTRNYAHDVVEHSGKSCPAIGKTCKSCNKQNHFVKMCRSNQVNEIAEENSSSEEECNLIL